MILCFSNNTLNNPSSPVLGSPGPPNGAIRAPSRWRRHKPCGYTLLPESPCRGPPLRASLTILYVTTYSGRVCRGSCGKLVRALTRHAELVPGAHLVNVEVVSRLGRIPFVTENNLRHYEHGEAKCDVEFIGKDKDRQLESLWRGKTNRKRLTSGGCCG